MQSLDGTWKLCWGDGTRGRLPYVPEYARAGRLDASRYLDARVPGEVHLDLARAGWIPDPYVKGQVLAARWVEECLWTYRREFTAPAAARSGRSWLVFEALDLAATVFLNGVEVGRHANAFRPLRLDVTGKLKAGRNVLQVVLDAGLYHAGDKPGQGYGGGEDSRLHKRHWLRQTQSQFSWDWSPRLLNVGLRGAVRLEWTQDPVRVDALVPLAEVSPDLARGTIRVRLFAEGLRKEPVRARLAVAVGSVTRAVPVEIKPGLHPVETTVEIEKPELWWPAGHGKQVLHDVRATLTVGGRAVGERRARIGFRRVRVNQDAHPVEGRFFVVEINNKPVFLKGGNLVPADMIVANLDRARYQGLVARALESNMNCLRVWGGGLYESDAFYDLCDEQGIVVWQEFIYACAKYPMIEEAFHEEAKREAVHQIRRLAAHPSLAIWCGNNEMEEGNWHWGYGRGVAHPDYAFFHMTLPRLLREEDPTRYYQPSSPFSPDHLDPNRPELGDQHPWTVGFHNTDFRDYRAMAHRFPNEGGILGPTALPTVRACLPEGTRDAKDSLAWDTHENSIAFWAGHRPPDRMLEQWLGKDRTKMSLEEWVYWGGVVQGEGLSEYIKNFRRRMFDSASAIFWMYNDTWPAVRSWTVVDYYLRRTPSFHPVRRAFAPLAVVVAREGDRVRIFGVNEGRRRQASLRFGFMALAGRYPVDETKRVTLQANASTPLAELDGKVWDRLGVKTHIAFALLTDDAGNELARDRLILSLFKEMRWPKARVSVHRARGKAVFTSRTFAWRVCLDLDGERPYPDNFFDVWPGVPTTLPWPASLPAPRVLRAGN